MYTLGYFAWGDPRRIDAQSTTQASITGTQVERPASCRC